MCIYIKVRTSSHWSVTFVNKNKAGPFKEAGLILLICVE